MFDVVKYGYPKELIPEDGKLPARVVAVHRGAVDAVCEAGIVRAKLAGEALSESRQGLRYPAVGDYAHLRFGEGGAHQILKLLGRRTFFARSDFSGHLAGYVKTVLEQVVAVNFDHVLIVSSLNRDFNPSRILRYLVLARQSGAKPCIVLTKADLTCDRQSYISQLREVAQGVPLFAVSSVTGEGLDDLCGYLKPGETIVLLGSSGVGKSSLINALEGEEVMQVARIREDDDRGRHTTTHRQLLLLKNGIIMIDSPGMRELGMLDTQAGLIGTFPDIEPYLASCRFSDCTHASEPGCAVQAALKAGDIAPERWESYLALLRETQFSARRAPKRGAKGKPVSAKRVALRYIDDGE